MILSSMKICPLNGFIHPFFEVWQSTLGVAENFTSYNKRGLTFLQMFLPLTITRHSSPRVVPKFISRTGKMTVFSECKCVITKFECLKNLSNPALNFGKSQGKRKKNPLIYYSAQGTTKTKLIFRKMQFRDYCNKGIQGRLHWSQGNSELPVRSRFSVCKICKNSLKNTVV